jgi:hypothetical protein
MGAKDKWDSFSEGALGGFGLLGLALVSVIWGFWFAIRGILRYIKKLLSI